MEAVAPEEVGEASPVTTPAGDEDSGFPAAVRRAVAGWRSGGVGHRAAVAAAAVSVLLLLLLAVRLPWAGDLGIHAATVDRLRTDLTDPGDPLVKADVDSPYFSPWMLTLAVLARVTGLATFTVLRFAALVGLVLVVTGVGHFTRTFTRHRAAVPLAVLSVLFLQGWTAFAWSGFPGLLSLGLCLAYPSTLAIGIAFHLWALLRKGLERRWGWGPFLWLGLLLGAQMLIHQFTGLVTVLGLLSILLGARPWPDRTTWLRVGAGCAVALALVLAWPYYSFFSLLSAGNLNPIHRALYQHLWSHYGLVLLGVAALALRLRRDRRDPLVLFFVLGAVPFALGGLTHQWAWARVLPAVMLPAQIALAVEVTRVRGTRWARASFAAVTAVVLLAGAWAQAGTLNYVLRPQALPSSLADRPYPKPWPSVTWATHYVRPGQVVMTGDYYVLRMLPAYGPYTVESAYPDFFLPDEQQRADATKRYFAAHTTPAQRAAVLAHYGVRWVVAPVGYHGLATDPSLVAKATDPAHRLRLYEVRSTAAARG
ncbi:hypothetical protein K7472_26965 [Streptomyces sp. PTM05]|uniref:Glycosyltransferase RgtA/B/C/D-like domain-containing protein n=1 Tax=Streptantibioticus parmotrematis TaxID=2873249 RepID=A0ABS7QZ24_9ACTN|nr:hypothetical protein [Streptantibioticus parmotrematis]MBY8888456.1 hypothetical protein [Streptantibioticus parmotrematis]